jgi:hypothetical protein
LATPGDEDNDPAGFTGPIICINPSVTGIVSTTQTAPISDPELDVDSIDTLDAEDVFILRYVLNGGGEGVDGTNEKVICHTVNDHNDCFRISPIPPAGD